MVIILNKTKMKSKILSLLLLVLITSSAWAQTYSGGDGTEGNPFQIANLTDLQYLSEHSGDWGLYFIQTANIDASATSTWNSGSGFSPIGTYVNFPFTGSFNGDNHTITGLNINRSSTNGVAMFGYTEGANIENVGLVNVSVVGNEQVSALVGRTGETTTISNCFSTGAISSGSYYGTVGGLIGYHAGSSSLENSYSRASITGTRPGGTRSLGGLIGSTHTSSVTNCYSTGAVSGGIEGYIGGLIGWSMATESNNFWDTQTSGQATSAAGVGKTTAEMQDVNLYMNATWDFMDEIINGIDDIWGINSAENGGYPFLAWQGYTNDAELSLSTQQVTNISTLSQSATANGTIYTLGVPAPLQHGVCWNTTGNPTLADNFTEEGVPSSGSFTSEMTGLTIHEVYYVRAYATNSSETVYGNEVSFVLTSAVAPSIGIGTSSSPYEIATLENLLWLSETQSEWAAGKYFIQTNNIDASVSTYLNEGKGFSPIGIYEWLNWSVAFQGSYNGQGHLIDGLYINRTELEYNGLFGMLYGTASVKNLGVTNANITGKGGASLVGCVYSSNVTISNCFATGTITSTTGYTGGLVELLAYGTMNNCYSNTVVIGNSYNGSLIGRVQGGKVYNCYAAGSVTKKAGSASYTYTGGFAGAIDNSAIVSNCYSTASVGDGNSLGGFVASLSSATVSNCFWDTQTSGQTTSAAGTGKTTVEMQSVCTYLDADWDFADENRNGTTEIWTINPTDNNGYPALAWQGYTNVQVAPTEAVSSILLSDITHNSITLQGFTAPTNGAEGYAIYINHEDANWTVPVDGVEPTPIVGDYDGNGSECVYFGTSATPNISLTGLHPNTSYFVKVYAYNSCTNVYWEKAGTIANETTIQKELTITGTFTVNSKVYDGTTDCVMATNNLLLDGVVGADLVSLDNIVLAFASSDVANGVLVNLLSAEISGDNANNYTLSLVEVPNTTADITAKSLSITANSESKAYGEIDPVFTVLYDGFIDGENESVLGGTLFIDRELGEDVGNYSISPSGLTSTNYSINFVNGNLAITAKELTVEGLFTALDKDYDGTTDGAVATNNLVLNGIIGIDEVSLDNIVLEFASSNVANNIIVSIASAELTGESANNYTLSLTGEPTTTANITSIALTITADNQSKVYGESDPVFTALYSGFIAGEDESDLGGSLAFNREPGEIVNTYTITPSGLTSTNYSIEFIDGMLTITPMELTIGGTFTAENKEYDGTVAASIAENNLTLQTPVLGDDVSLTTIVVEFASATVADENLVSIVSAVLDGTDKDNYTLSLAGAYVTTASTTAKELIISGTFTVENKEYDGTVAATIVEHNLTLHTLVSGDDVILTAIVAEFATATIADGIVVNIVSAELDGADKDNYTLSLDGAPTTLANITEPVGVETDALKNLTVFPNPFTNTINIANAENAQRVVISNIIGKIVMNIDLTQLPTHTLSTNLPRGVYLVTLVANDGSRVVRKMVRK